MTSFARKSIATVFAGSVLAVGAASPASAAPPIQVQDGLVNVTIGDVTIAEDVNVGVAALVAANACDLVNVGQVAVLARAVDRSSGGQETVCTVDGRDVVIEQN